MARSWLSDGSAPVGGAGPLRRLALVASVVALSLAGCAGPGGTGGDGPVTPDGPAANAPGDPGDLEGAKDLALEAAATHPAVDFDPYRATEADPSRPFFPDRQLEAFGDYHFVYVWSELGHTENSPFAVSPDGEAFKLPEDFGQLSMDAGIEVRDADEARILLEFFLDLHAAVPGTDRLVVLDTVTDIPGVDGGQAERHRDAVRPPSASADADGWTFEFHAWRAVGGELSSWQVHVSRAGEIRVERMQVEDEELGDHITVE